jgi:hypothetical protein
MTVSGNSIVSEVLKFAGDPYVYGASGPSSFDCSGLVQYVLTQLGVSNVPRTSEEQWAWVDKIDASQLAPGDLVFAQFPGDNASPGHVGVYVGNGEVLSAEDPQEGVGYDSLSDWGSSIVGYGRVPNSAAGSTEAVTTSALGGALSIPGQITGFFSDADGFVNKAMWLVNPSSWLRIGAFLIGVALLLFAIHAMIAAGNGSPLFQTPNFVPVPV